MAKELKTTRLQMVVEPSLIELIDRFRRDQIDIPSRSEAIRRLLIAQLSSRGYNKFDESEEKRWD